jgi:hypothetical protein
VLDKVGVPIPEVRGAARMIAPDGQVVWSADVGGVFPRKKSKYFITSVKAENKYYGMKSELYDFGSLDPRKAMAEEAWDDLVKNIGRLPLHTGFARENGKVVPLSVLVRTPGR